jgi:hypothetical protein
LEDFNMVGVCAVASIVGLIGIVAKIKLEDVR